MNREKEFTFENVNIELFFLDAFIKRSSFVAHFSDLT